MGKIKLTQDQAEAVNLSEKGIADVHPEGVLLAEEVFLGG